MARAPDQRVEEARRLFDSGMKLIEVSEKLGVPEGTVRSWKNVCKCRCVRCPNRTPERRNNMALPQDGQNANGLTKVTKIPKLL